MLLTGLLCGILLGFVMQRGRFCITGAFRDMYVTKNNKMFVALLLAITVQSIGFFLLKEIGILNVDPAENFAFLAVIIGAFLFGIGIVLAGGCATGTWYRAAEGLVGSWVALFTYMLLSAIMRTGPLGEFNKTLRSINIEQRNLVVSRIINFSDSLLCIQTSQQTKRKSCGIKTEENGACSLII